MGTQDIRVTIANIIRVALGLLGIVAVVIIIYGGVMYLTSAGEPEKIKKAKDLLIAAIIGLVIILTSFAIASFIIGSILNATGPGPGVNGVINPTCEGPECNPPGGCADPEPTSNAPFICKLDPNQGPKGQFVTIQGGKFGSYLATYTKVFFRQGSTDYEATVALCNGKESWNNNQIVVEVPNNLVFDQQNAANNKFKVVVKIEGYDSSQKSTGGDFSGPNDQFTLDEGQPGPGIACLVPDSGKENTAVNVFGKRFGATKVLSSILRFFENVDATVSDTDWTDIKLSTSVPVGAKRGNVYVTVNGHDSNGYGFIVTCDTKDDCGSKCCFSGYFGKECAEENYCKPGPNQSCDCSADNCQTGLFCDATKSCTCQPAGPGTPCDRDTLTPSCEPDNNKCGQGLYCSVHAIPGCTCQYLPRIDDVQPRDGAPGNFITLWGRGFGSIFNASRTKVIFLGDPTDPTDDKEGVFPSNCSAAQFWQDTQVVVAIPDGAVNGPLKLINSDGLADTTADDNGWQGDFTINAIIRPGLCPASPDYGAFNDRVDLSGTNFGSVGQSLIGGTEFNKGSTWSWTNITISDVTVPNILTGVLPIQVKVGTENSNPVNFTVTIPALLPRIDYVDPTSGPTDQYVTIFGANFGTEAGTVRFDNGESNQDIWALANTLFPDACKLAGYWHDKYIVVKVPGEALIGTSPTSHIVVITNSEYGAYPSNVVSFTHNNAKASPGICAIAPDQGPIGLAGVTLYGEKFDTYGAANSKVKFWDSKTATDAVPPNWSDTQVGSGTLHTPPMTVPVGATTGPVQLTDQNGILSNKISFTVGDCRQDNTLCTSANPCCDPRDGVCKSQSACQIVYPAMCAYTWSFTTGKMPVTLPPPQVIEDKTCIDNTQSPEPWKNSAENCANLWIKARFNQQMDVTTFNTNNILVQACGTEETLNESSCSNVNGTVDSFQGTGILFKPQNDLVPNTWYRVTLNGHTDGIKSADEVLLDGNFDNIAGGDYVWSFRIRNSDKACDVDKVVVVPQEATLTKLSETQPYEAFALAANCNDLNEDVYDWHWYKKYSDNFIEEAGDTTDLGHGIAKITTNDLNNDGNIDYHQVASPVKQGLVYVGAEVFPGDALKNRNNDKHNRLVVDLNIPEITDFYPKDGLVRPEVNTYVTIYGNHFGKSQGVSQVLFDDVPAPLADCGKAWSDEIIKVKVPLGQPIKPGADTTYQLPSSTKKKEGMVAYYNFEETNSALVSDKANNNDAEIKGTPTRVSDQFGQAMAFNGTSDYLKLPNDLEMTTGSLEVWFKPEGPGLQTIFSATDGTSTNAFSLDYKSGNNTRGIIKDNWNYLVYTYDGHQATLYVNGFKFTDFTYTGILLTPQTGGFIGANKTNILLGAINTGTLANYFKGRIDNFALYNKVLTDEEVRANFGLKDGQVLFLKFEDPGSTITDSSANHFTDLEITDKAKSFKSPDGISGQALKFNNDNSLMINNDPSLVFNKEISIEGWFKIDSLSDKTIFQADDIALQISNNQLLFAMQIFSSSLNNKSAQIDLTDANLNKWNYFAAVYDGQKIKIYLNGNEAENSAVGSIFQEVNLNRACLGGETTFAGSCTKNFVGSLDEIAIYNRALSDTEISSRLGAKDNSFIKVITSGGSASTDKNNDGIKDAGETFRFSDNLYPFLCQLAPDSGTAGTTINIDGDNLGDSNKTTFQNKSYGVGSYMHFAPFGLDILSEDNIKGWANKLLNINNPYSEVNYLTNGNPVISISASIDPYSEPYNPTNYSTGSYTNGDEFADTKDPICPTANNPSCYNLATYPVGGVGLHYLKSNSLPFALPPVITSITPDNGPIKTWVTIRGYNFGTNPGQVYFYNNQVAGTPPSPCENTWTNTQIIAVVPDGSTSGEVYVQTANLGLQSNKVNFTVNNNPLGAGLCQLAPDRGLPGDTAYALGDRFGEIQDSSQLIFSTNQNATIALNGWSNNSLEGIVPVDATNGDVVVTKKLETGRVCAGFHIGSWCPGADIKTGQGYDIIFQDVPSNPLYFNVNTLGCSGNLGTDAGLVAGYPLKPFDSSGPSSVANTAVIATDGQYLYTKSWGSGSYAYGPPDTIYKIGTGFGSTKAGEIVKVYSLATGSNPAPMYSMIYHSDGKFYAGAAYTSNNIARLVFNDSASTYQVIADATIPEKLYDISGTEPSGNTKSALITSNGNLIFNVGTEFSGGYIDKIKVKIFNPANNWQLVKKFEIPTDKLTPQPGGGGGIVADNNFIYLFPSTTQDVLVIDWQKEGVADQWYRDHAAGGSLYEINGQFDWQHQVFWLGDLQYNPPGLYNNIYKYNACALAGTCKKDEDCAACGSGTSKCINGTCQPYIKQFTPVSGAVGNYTLLTGCYLCPPGTIYFTGQIKTNSSTTVPTNPAAYFPLSSDVRDYSANNNTVNFYNCGATCTVSDPSAYLANGVILTGHDYVKAENVQIQPSFTALAWAKSDTDNWNTYGWIASARQIDGFIIHSEAGTTYWSGYILRDDPTLGTGNVENVYAKIATKNAGNIKQWHQYGVMYDAVNKLAYMIFDGQFVVNGQSLDITRVTAPINIYIGEDSPPQFGRVGKGAVNGVLLYNRLLGAAEITDLYNSGNTYVKTWVPAAVPQCNVTWQCSANADQDKVLTEVPMKSTGTTDDDAITGPLKLVTGSGLVDTTDDLTPSDFTVSTGTNICSLDGGLCGNGAINPGEDCDGTNLNGKTCQNLGHGTGTLLCSGVCHFDYSQCSLDGGLCGNGAINPGEDCDGTNLNGKTCASTGHGTGTLSCGASCLFDYTQCSLPPSELCPNGNIDSGEACDGTNLNGKTCASEGHGTGTLLCNSACQFDFSQCSLDGGFCGNGNIDRGEDCDGLNLNGQTCQSLSHGSGNLLCSSCLFDYSQCSLDGGLCGNGNIDSGEACDGTNLNGKTCASEGHGTGTLSCSACAFDFSQCSLPSAAVCGNGVVELGETCDDGNLINGDGCSNTCQIETTTAVCGNGVIESGETCDDGNLINGDGCSSTCQIEVPVNCGNNIIDYPEECDNNTLPSPLPNCPFDKPNCTFSCSGACILLVCDASGQNCVPLAAPKVEATVPHQAEAFCRNGIIDIYFDSPIDSKTIEKIETDTLTRNINIESCTSGTLSLATDKNQGILSRSLAFIKNIVYKLFAYKTETLAALSDCTAFDNKDFYLHWGLVNDKTAVQLIPINLLEPEHYYRVRLSGGDTGIKNLNGINLDITNTPASDSAFPDDYIFEFKTMGSASDSQSGICNVDWIDTLVYRQPYTGTDFASRNAEYRSNDLFTCAGKDDCNLETDYDQDGNITGNQHIYQAIARYRGEFSLKADYQWSKNDSTDPDKAIEIYNQTSFCIAGDLAMLDQPCTSNAQCGTGGICDQGDISTDPYKVKNTNGYTYTTAKPVKEATANLVIEAKAQGSSATPVQQSFTVYLLLCENPWPSLAEKFPLSNLINTYNYHTYYCRDAGPPGPEGDLPAARILVPNIANLNILENTDFEYGNLSNWVDLQEGSIFASQPVKSKIAAEGWIINTAYRQLGKVSVYDGEVAEGKLQSQAFVIEGDELKFNLGGTNDPNVKVVFAVKSNPAGVFVDKNTETGTGSDLLIEKTIDLTPYTTARSCTSDSDCNGYGTCDTENGQCTPILGIIRIEDNSDTGHIDFDKLRQFKNGTQINLQY